MPPPPQQNIFNDINIWINSVPRITRFLFFSTLILSLGCILGVCYPYQVALYLEPLLKKYQVKPTNRDLENSYMSFGIIKWTAIALSFIHALYEFKVIGRCTFCHETCRLCAYLDYNRTFTGFRRDLFRIPLIVRGLWYGDNISFRKYQRK